MPGRPVPATPRDLRPADLIGAFFLAGVLFLAAGAVCGLWQMVEPWAWGRWLALHLAFVGGVTLLILGASQFFTVAFLATDPPPRGLVRGQLSLWCLGSALLAVAVPAGWTWLLWPAVFLLVAALGLWAGAVVVVRGRSLSRAPWATRWYLTGAAFFAAGMAAGSILAGGIAWSHGYLLGAHMSLNLAGFFGAAIVGTLHTFYPSLTQTQLRFPYLQPVSFIAWSLGVLCLAVGYGWSLDSLTVLGWIGLCAGALALLVNLAGCRLDAARELSLAARTVGVAQPFLLAGLLLVTATAVADGPALALSGSTRIAAGTLLVVGWIGLTVLGSLLHLLAIVVRVRNRFSPMPSVRPRLDIPATVVALVGIGLLAVCQLDGFDRLGSFAELVVLIVYAHLGARVGILTYRVLAKARPGI